MIIGISGKSGSGKSSIAKYLSDNYNYYWIDTDKIAKEIRTQYMDQIVELVKDSNIVENNVIDSKKLGAIIFKDKTLLEVYNEFVYKKMKDEINELIDMYANVVVDSLFLPIMDVYNDCDYTILVKCDDSLRKQRIIKRDNIDEQYYLNRDSNSLEYQESDFDFIINNNENFKDQLEMLIKEIHNI